MVARLALEADLQDWPRERDGRADGAHPSGPRDRRSRTHEHDARSGREPPAAPAGAAGTTPRHPGPSGGRGRGRATERMRRTLLLVCPLPDCLDHMRYQQPRVYEAYCRLRRAGRDVGGWPAENDECGGRCVMEGIVEWLGLGDDDDGAEGSGGGGGAAEEMDGRSEVLRGGVGAETGGKGQGSEGWRRYWRPRAHGFVVPGPGQEPEIYYLGADTVGRALVPDDTSDQGGWVGSGVPAWDWTDLRRVGAILGPAPAQDGIVENGRDEPVEEEGREEGRDGGEE